jgi:hypothetical protein
MTKSNRTVRQELALLNGDPNQVEFNFSDEKTKSIQPYTKPANSSDPDDQFTEIVTFRVDGALKRLGEETTALLHPWYRTHSDLARDAYFKWIKFLQESYLAPGSNIEPVAMKLDMLSKQAYETDQRRRFAELVSTLDRNLTDLLNDNAIEKLAEECSGYCETIQQINDTYWRNRTIREFCEMQSFKRMLRVLKADPNYQSTGLVKLLSQWESSRFVQQREAA